jgi:hypothetical protein
MLVLGEILGWPKSAPPRDEPREHRGPGPVTGSCRTRPAFRRSTAFSCRSASNSAPLARSPRNMSTPRLNNQRISRQAIFSSIWPANHHRQPAQARSTTRSSFERHTIYFTRLGAHPNPASYATGTETALWIGLALIAVMAALSSRLNRNPPPPQARDATPALTAGETAK